MFPELVSRIVKSTDPRLLAKFMWNFGFKGMLSVERFKARFSSGKLQTLVAVLHSHLSAGERHDEWHKIRSGRARIVIGARSAIFAPVEPLGLIIVDEEHEQTYKQEEAPRYHARDVAVMRGQM